MKLFQKQDEHSRSLNSSHKQFQYLYNSSTKAFTGEGLVSKEKARSRYGQKYIFCNDDHWSDECWKYRDIQPRQQKLKNRCFKCGRCGRW